MGIKGLYGYCTREVKTSYKTVNILEEIEKYKSEHQKQPLIIINLSTLSYHFKLNNQDMICGYQLNKIKYDLENFLSELQMAGADLEFVFKKTIADDKEWKKRRLDDYKDGCEIIKRIEKLQSFEKLERIYRRGDRFPYNTMILVAIIQSAAKFGQVHGCNSIKGKPSVQQVELARIKKAAWIMGLDTYYFLFPGPWKIWCDSKLNMKELTVQELDPNLVMSHFEVKPEQASLFACLIGDLQSIPRVNRKVIDHFGSKSLFPNAAKCIRKLSSTSTDGMIQEIMEKIFGEKADAFVADDFKKTLKSFEIDENAETNVDMELLEMVKNDFLSIAEEILTNQPIFINPSYLDMRKKDMATVNDLVLPLIQKTSGILLKNFDDPEPRSLVLLMSHDGDFVHVPVEPIFPDFEVPSLKVLIGGHMSTIEKMSVLFWITDLTLKDFELPVIPEEYVVDCIILLYLLKNKSLKIIDARCILKTLVDARRRAVPLEVSTEYPEVVNERAFRVTFLYSKMYFFFHSCLSSLGMKNLCPDIEFDGVYFQKMYAVNILEAVEKKKQKENDEDLENSDPKAEEPEEEVFSQTDIIDDFAAIIRM